MSYAHVNVKYKLFRTFCMLLYGALFWDLGSRNTARFYVIWRKCKQ